MTLVKVNNPFARSIDGWMKDVFNEFPVAAGKSLREDVLHFPPTNITDKETAYVVEMQVPGFEKADFNVKLDNNVLTVSAEKKEENASTTDKVVRREFSKKAFKRSFTVDDKINTENISAKYDNGILVLELPKKEVTKAVAKEISIL